ncbi:MAG: hypothetical protein AB1609_13875 [Bacillota bacterium]
MTGPGFMGIGPIPVRELITCANDPVQVEAGDRQSFLELQFAQAMEHPTASGHLKLAAPSIS